MFKAKLASVVMLAIMSTAAFAQVNNQFQSSYEMRVEATGNSAFHEGIVDGISDMIKIFEDQSCSQLGNMKIEITPEGSFGKQLGREIGVVDGRTAKVSGVLSCTGTSKIIRAKVIVRQSMADSTHANIQVTDTNQNRVVSRYSFIGDKLQ